MTGKLGDVAGRVDIGNAGDPTVTVDLDEAPPVGRDARHPAPAELRGGDHLVRRDLVAREQLERSVAEHGPGDRIADEADVPSREQLRDERGRLLAEDRERRRLRADDRHLGMEAPLGDPRPAEQRQLVDRERPRVTGRQREYELAELA